MCRTAREHDQRADTWDLPYTAQCRGGFLDCKGRGELKLDPFQYDVENRAIRRYLCDSCEQKLADDI